MPRIDPRISSSIAIMAIALWLGGILVLGAITAPIVFHVVPAPTNADAMTLVFRRFDRVASGCALVVILVEVLLATSRTLRLPRLDFARLGATVIAFVLELVQAVWISPAIEALHRAGAVRGQGPLGQELQTMHHMAELCGKTQALLLAALLVLHVFTAARRSPVATVRP